MKLNVWHRSPHTGFYRYYFAEIGRGEYFGVEYSVQLKRIVARSSITSRTSLTTIDIWPEQKDNLLNPSEIPVFDRYIYEKKIIDFTFLHGEIL